MTTQFMTMNERVLAVLKGSKPDRIPFIDRLEIWHKAKKRNNNLPAQFHNLELPEIHRQVGMGQQRFFVPYALRLRGVEVITQLNGKEVFREQEPLIKEFPGMWDLVSGDEPGTTETTLITPAGKLFIKHELHEMGILSGTTPYLKSHLINGSEDYAVVERIVEQAEVVPLFNEFRAEQELIGNMGLVVPLVHRIPFQQVLLEYLGETKTYYELQDSRKKVERLMEVLDQQMLRILSRLAELPAPYIEFPDNLHGQMTSPSLFTDYCLPHYQKYSEKIHANDKKVGSHVDGELKPLFKLLAETGLDVCESISPAPLSSASFEEIWEGMRGGPIIWGGIPSTVLEERTPEKEFREFVKRLLDIIGDDPIILGVGDMVMGNNDIERVRFIARCLESQEV